VGASGVGPDFPTPYGQNFTLNIQQQLSSKTVLQVGYGGSKNPANFANPGINRNAAASFGLIANTRNGAPAPGIGFGEPRNIQLALKLLW
jgi:hypothetical protein